MRYRSSFVLAVSALVIVLVACGGGGDKKKTAATTSTSIDADFCTLAVEYAQRTQPALAEAVDGARRDPVGFRERMRNDFREAHRQNGLMAATAPSAIRTDMEYMASVFDAYYKALEAASFDPNKVEPQAVQRLQDVPYQEASKRVNDYAESTCTNFASTTTTTSTPPTTAALATSTTRRPTTTTSRPAPTTTVAPTTTTVAPTTVPEPTTTTLPPTTVTTLPPTTTSTICNEPIPDDC